MVFNTELFEIQRERKMALAKLKRELAPKYWVTARLDDTDVHFLVNWERVDMLDVLFESWIPHYEDQILTCAAAGESRVPMRDLDRINAVLRDYLDLMNEQYYCQSQTHGGLNPKQPKGLAELKRKIKPIDRVFISNAADSMELMLDGNHLGFLPEVLGGYVKLYGPHQLEIAFGAKKDKELSRVHKAVIKYIRANGVIDALS